MGYVLRSREVIHVLGFLAGRPRVFARNISMSHVSQQRERELSRRADKRNLANCQIKGCLRSGDAGGELSVALDFFFVSSAQVVLLATFTDVVGCSHGWKVAISFSRFNSRNLFAARAKSFTHFFFK